MLKTLSVILVFYLLGCLFLYVKQRSLLFYPTPENFNADAEPLWIQTENAKLKVWKINQAEPAIIYFGGNAEAIENNIQEFKLILPGYSVYLVNYRGYGGSSGIPTETGLFEDALAVYDQLKKQHSTISVIGRSLGSGVASYLASKRDISKLVLTTPYDSISNVAQSHYPVFPAKWLIKDPFDSTLYVPSVNSKILVLYAEHDNVIPMIRTKKLFKFLPEFSAQMIKGTNHNNISSHPHYQKLLAEFMNTKE